MPDSSRVASADKVGDPRLPLISVVTPSFRQLEWLALAMASVADQEGVEIEHIVQDGGTEGVREVFHAITKSPRAHYTAELFVENDEGMYDAINRGLKRTRGEICCYLNCDEQYLPGTLRTVTNYFAAHPETDLLFADAILVDPQGLPVSYRRIILPTIEHLRFADLNTLTCATFFRRRLLESGHFFPTNLKTAGDQLWVYRLLKAGASMAALPKPLSIFAFTGTNLSHSAAADDEKFGWLPEEERPKRHMTPLVVARHRLGKFLAGAYRKRNVTIDIHTRDQPEKRRRICARVGFRWPKGGAV